MKSIKGLLIEDVKLQEAMELNRCEDLDVSLRMPSGNI